MKRLWLIDAGYVYATSNEVLKRGERVDYRLLRRLVESELGVLWRAYYLNAVQDEPHGARDRFHNWLQAAPPNGPQLIVKLYGLKQERVDNAYCLDCQTKVQVSCPNDPHHRLGNQRQKGVDVGIATIALAHKERYDTLVLSSGDGDLADAVEHLSEMGKGIELAVFSSGVSTDLQARADRVLWLDEHMDRLIDN